jgi:hypothetical protein
MLSETVLELRAAQAGQVSIRRKINSKLTLNNRAADQALMDSYRPEAEIVDRAEQAAFHKCEQLRRAIAASLTRETGELHWYGDHADTNASGVVIYTRTVRPVNHQPATA